MTFEMRYFKGLIAALVALLLMGSLTACSSAPSVDINSYQAIIDVRTPQEFATGHLDGAINIDIRGAEFASSIGALDKTANYFIYCHSGNRAGQAVDYMTGAGFSGTLTNGGSVDAAAASTGLQIVNN